MSAHEEQVLKDAENAVRGGFINYLIEDTREAYSGLLDAILEATANFLPTARETVGDEAGEAVAVAHLRTVFKRQDPEQVATALAFATVRLVKAERTRPS